MQSLPEHDDLVDLKRSFHLGRFCARRTRAFHSFSHWEHDLYSALEDHIQTIDGYRRMKPDAVMEQLDNRGIVEREWRRLNDMIESARHLEVAAKRGEDNDGEL